MSIGVIVVEVPPAPVTVMVTVVFSLLPLPRMFMLVGNAVFDTVGGKVPLALTNPGTVNAIMLRSSIREINIDSVFRFNWVSSFSKIGFSPTDASHTVYCS